MSPVDPLLNKVVGGRYQLLEGLGKGGMGSGYKAKQLSMDRLVAVKLIHPALAGNPAIAARFHREMQATARVEHPNTVQVFDFGEAEEGQLFLVMEFLRGCTLAQLLDAEGWLPATRLIPIAVQIVRAIGAAHAKDIVHRDLKPENVMLVDRFGERDFVKVLDFGVAHFLAGEAAVARMTADGSLIGTPAYMSPEQACGDPVGPKSDLYSLGVLLYHAALGLPPFEGSTLPQILQRQLTQPPKAPSEIAPGRLSRRLEELILRLLEKDPARRPPDAESVAAELAAALPQESSQAEQSLERTSIRASATPAPAGSRVPWGQSPSGPDLPRPSAEAPRAAAPTKPSTEPGRAPPPEPRDPPAARRHAPRSTWKVVAALLTVGVGAGAAVVLVPRNTLEDTRARGKLDQLLLSDGDPAAPEACRAKRTRSVQLLVRPAELLVGAAIGSVRPADREALELLEKSESSLDAEAEYWVLRARAQLAVGSSPEQARQAAETAARRCPGYAVAYKLAGNALQKAGLNREARAAYGRALEAEPAYLAPMANLGLVALKEQDTAAAVAAFDQVLARTPGDFSILLARSEARRMAGDPALAIADLDAAAKANPKSAEAPLRRGQLLESLGRHDEARQAFCQARALGSTEAARGCP